MNLKPKKILIVAGEASGDMHAANLVHKLLATNKNLQIDAVGGTCLSKIKEVNMLNMLAEHGVIGFVAVLTHAFILRKAYTKITQHMRENRPQLVILVDFPGFNLRLAKCAKDLGLKVLYYISPQVWAWKAKRINHIKKYVDHMAVVLPFEKAIYQKENIPCSFVGHPILSHLINMETQEARSYLNLPQNNKIIALLPGSRKSEIKRHMPVLVQTIMQLNKHIADLKFILPLAPTISRQQLTPYLNKGIKNLKIIQGETQQAIKASDFVIVASGTASLESALLLKPMCIIYKVSIISSMIVGKVVKIRYAGLCNLIAGSMLVPELLQYDCTADTLTNLVLCYLTDLKLAETLVNKLKTLKQTLTLAKADLPLETLVTNLLP
ncbi:MAG: lipid-A-disaccharide synthase [Legionellales bacterium RIFCSPHIGHO2_12_FULL_37_14]|nr:MAG: lipid-A-disaccharide synthase [Legionellales bacterium RIFCSPHIGHO2_12_FULL_37_14]